MLLARLGWLVGWLAAAPGHLGAGECEVSQRRLALAAEQESNSRLTRVVPLVVPLVGKPVPGGPVFSWWAVYALGQ